MSEAKVDEHILGITMDQQHILKKDIKECSDKREKSTAKELKQLHDTPTFTPVDSTKMTKK